MADFKINVTAETQAAERKLQAVDKAANEATKKRTLNIDVTQIGRDFSNIEKSLKEAGNTIQTFYRVSKNVPGIGDKVRQYEDLAKNVAETAKNAPASAAALRENAKAGSILANSLELAGSKASGLVSNLAKIGFATFAVKQAVGVLQAAFGGFFNETIGREIKLRETILKTQTTLASTNKVFRDGKEVTDPYQKIVTLSGEVSKRIDSIRERSIALAGVTSGEVIEVFGIVASQVGQIGGGLKEAEDLAINFAAALGTFGIPLYQARQEIGSILRADITTDSYLAKALGITNEDVARAKTQTGGVVKFLEDRLSAAVAGQRIAAQGFSGVVSNLKDITELVGQAFGRGLLDPLLTGLTKVFETLFRIRSTLFDIAEGAGRTIGRVSSSVIGLTAGRTGVGQGIDTAKLANNAKDVAQEAFSAIEGIAQRTVGAIAMAFSALKPSILVIADAFRVLTKAFLEIKAGTFEALASAVANLVVVLEPAVTVFAALFNVYARFLDLPGVQYIAELAAVLGLLKRAGLDAATNIALLGRFIVSSVVPAIGALGTFMATLVAGIGAAIIAVGQLTLSLAGLATALMTPFNVIPAVAAALKNLSGNLTSVATNTTKAGDTVKNAASSFQVLGSSAKAAGLSIVTSLGWVFLIQVGIAAIVDAFGKYQRAQEEAARTGKAMQALHELSTTYKDVADNADSATKAAVAFRQGLVDTEYNRTIERLEEISSKLNDLEYEARAGIQTWGELWRLLGGFAASAFTFDGSVDPFGGSKEASRLIAEQAKLREFQRKRDAERDKADAAANIQLQATKRVNLEKEIFELQRQHNDQLFQSRQQAAQKEVEVFRAAGELRIMQIEAANRKLIEGEEGASRTALEALDNWIATKERGELEIEASKQTIAIEIQNLEKTVADYRLDMEKKIFEIRKRANENDVSTADALARQASAGGGGSATIASIADSSMNANAKGWLAAIRAAEGTAGPDGYRTMFTGRLFSDMSKHPRQLNSGGGYTSDAAGAYQFLSTTWDGVGGGSMDPIRQDKAAAALALRRGVDISSAPFNQANVARLAPEWASLPMLNGASAHGQPVKSFTRLKGVFNAVTGGANSSAAAPTTAGTQQRGISDLGTASQYADELGSAISRVTTAMERLRAIQAQISSAKTAEEFERITQQVFEKAPLEGFTDQLQQAATEYQLLIEYGDKAYGPERAALEAEIGTRRKRSQTELAQIIQGVNERVKAGTLEQAKATEYINKAKVSHNGFLKSLQEEANLRAAILTQQQASQLLESFRQQQKQSNQEIQELQTRARLEAEGVRPELITAELAKLSVRKRLEATLKDINEQLSLELQRMEELERARDSALGSKDQQRLQDELNRAIARVRFLEDQLASLPKAADSAAQTEDEKAQLQIAANDPVTGLMNKWKVEIQDTRTMIASLGQTIQSELGSTLSTAISGVISGTATIGEAFGQMFANIGKAFIDMATQMIAKALIMKVLGIFMGGGSSPFSGNASIGEGGGFGSFTGGAFGSGGVGDLPGLGGAGALNTPGLYSGVGFRANGGPVTGGSPYVVGERGPELFVPGTGGSVVSTSDLRSAMGAAPGMGGSPVLNMSFETTNFGGVEYVSRDQLELAMAATRRQAARDGAQRGMTMTLDRLQQSPNTRRRVGF